MQAIKTPNTEQLKTLLDMLNKSNKNGNAGVELLPNGAVLIHLSSENVLINRKAIYNLVTDMDRDYETAGYLLGRYDPASGKTEFQVYRPSKSVRRRLKTSASIDPKRKYNEILHYRHDGFNAIASVHLHPSIPFSYSLNEELDEADKRAALDTLSDATKVGFAKVYKGVLSKYREVTSVLENANKAKMFRLSLFDVAEGSKQEGFQITGEYKIDIKQEISTLLRKSLQTTKYELDEMFVPTTLVVSKINADLSPKEILDIEKNIKEYINGRVPSFISNLVYKNNKVDVKFNAMELEIKVGLPPKAFYWLFGIPYNDNERAREIIERANISRLKRP